MSGFGARYSAFDCFQQRHRWLGFPVATLQKYADDQGGYLAGRDHLLRLLRGLPAPARPDDRARFRPSRPPTSRAVDRRCRAWTLIGPELKLEALHGNGLVLLLSLCRRGLGG